MPRIAYFGPAGTFTETATARFQDTYPALAAATRTPVRSPAHALDAVRDGSADFAVVPIESSVEGSVPATMDGLVSSTTERVQIVAENRLPVRFALAVADPDAPVRTIAGYPVATAQVRLTLERLYPDAEVTVATSNAAAAAEVAAGRADAAVTTDLAAANYGLAVAHRDVADNPEAFTRFILVSRPGQPPAPTGSDRTAVALLLPDEPGSLVAALNEFAVRGVDLTRIESRPARQTAVPYVFFLDAVGHIFDPAVREALGGIYRRADTLFYMGSWPADAARGAAPPRHESAETWLDSLGRPAPAPQRGSDG